MTTSKAETSKVEADAESAGELAMTTRQFVAFPTVRRKVGFHDDPKRKASATSRPPLTFVFRLAIVAPEVFEELVNRR
jgi:hypothetical protein